MGRFPEPPSFWTNPFDGGSILVEVADDLRVGLGSTLRGGHASAMIEKARISYEESLDEIKGAAETIVLLRRWALYPTLRMRSRNKG